MPLPLEISSLQGPPQCKLADCNELIAEHTVFLDAAHRALASAKDVGGQRQSPASGGGAHRPTRVGREGTGEAFAKRRSGLALRNISELGMDVAMKVLGDRCVTGTGAADWDRRWLSLVGEMTFEKCSSEPQVGLRTVGCSKSANGQAQVDQSSTISVFQKTNFGIYPSK